MFFSRSSHGNEMRCAAEEPHGLMPTLSYSPIPVLLIPSPCPLVFDEIPKSTELPKKKRTIHKSVLHLQCQTKRGLKHDGQTGSSTVLERRANRRKIELEKISYLLQAGVKPTKEIKGPLDKMLDRKKSLEQLIEEVRNTK